MRWRVLLLFWGKRAPILFLWFGVLVIALWTCIILAVKENTSPDGELNLDKINKYGENHQFIIKKLISNANRLLRSEQKQRQQELTKIAVPAAAHTSHADASKIFRVNNRNSDTDSQSLLLGRLKKSPVVGETYLFEEERLQILKNQQRARNAAFDDFLNANNNNNNNNMDYNMMSSAERQIQYEHELQRMGVPVIASIGPDGPMPPRERLIHLDLKGAPPKLSFLKRLLPMLKTLGATGLLIEYEDMFPYTGNLAPLAAKNAYQPDELKDFLDAVAFHGLTIMPLIQTFGHLEYALKLEEFERLREISESPQSICPSQRDSIEFLEAMLTQVIEFHLPYAGAAPSSSASASPEPRPVSFTHIHIGCDEVARMGECEKCRQRSRNEIFLTHVTTMGHYIRTRWPQLNVVIWDDMLRDMTLSEMQHSQIGNYVEPMVWVYVPDVYHFIQPQLWDMYAKVFPTAWAASAFKGAFGESLMIPPIQQHLENNIRWLAVIAKEGGRFSKGFRGLAITGWQRYDHFAVLCELLPTGIPNLIASLSTVSKGYFSTNPKENSMLRVLECEFHPDSRRSGHPWIELFPQSHHSQLFNTCIYPGHMTYKFMLNLFEKLTAAQNYLTHVQERSAWMSDYNVRHNFSSPLRVHGLTANTPALINELSALGRNAREVLYEAFDEYTIAEFIEQTIYPVIVALNCHLERGKSLQRHVWPQRPLPINRELVDFNMIPVAIADSDINICRQDNNNQKSNNN